MSKGRVAVDAFMATLDHPRKTEIEAIRRLILGAVDGAEEGIKWNAPSFSLGAKGEHFATFHLRQPGVVQLVLHTGAKKRPKPLAMRVDDPAGLLSWPAKDRAVVTFADASAQRDAFEAILHAWIEGLRAEG